MTGESATGPQKGAPHSDVDLIPPEFLRVIAIWSLIPAYIVAGGFVGYLLDRWFGTSPYLLALGLAVALALAVRDMWRLRDAFQPTPGGETRDE